MKSLTMSGCLERGSTPAYLEHVLRRRSADEELRVKRPSDRRLRALSFQA
jgi:hypothetical protein